MCDERTLRDAEDYLRRSGRLTRRKFGALSVGTGLAMLLPRAASALQVTAENVEVSTPDGTADCHFVHPSSGAHPGVLIWPDALGLRPAFEQMGRRLAESGYAVLVVNPYYRTEKAPVLPEGASFRDEATRKKIFPLMRSLTPERTVADASAFVGYPGQPGRGGRRPQDGDDGILHGRLHDHAHRGGVPRPDWRRRLLPRRQAGDRQAADSPHLLVDRIRAHYLFAIAENDDGKDPQAKTALREAFDAAGLPAEIEVYTDTLHGWCPPDSAVYNEAQAERAWSRLLALFETALA